MDADLNALALTTLDLMTTGARDEELAEALGDHESAALGAAYLAAFSIQCLALHRAEPVDATIRYLRGVLGDGDGDGVREPRHPRPSPGGASRTIA